MDCPICLQDPEHPIVLACCKNIYCSKCIVQWNQVRNVCPLCCNVNGKEEKNELKAQVNAEFDDGSLMLETEMKDILDRILYVEQRVRNRRDQFKNGKSVVSASLIDYLQKQVERMDLFKNLMQEQWLLHNRVSTVEYMQLLTEAILQIEDSLQKNSVMIEQDYDYEYEDEQYMNEIMDEYEQYEEFEEMVGKQANYGKGKKPKSRTNAGEDLGYKMVKLS